MSELVDYATLLFATPSFYEGVGRVVDLGGTLTEFNRSGTVEEADRVALASDWAAVGADLRVACAAAQGAHEQDQSA